MGKDKWSELGMGVAGQAAGGLVGTGMGLLLEGHNDRRQLEQERKLQEQQMGFNKQMADYNQMLGMKTWNETNYGAQVAHMKAAGLNPGLLYGMGGGGGATAPSGTGSAPQGGSAPRGGGEAMGMGLAGAQMQLIAAQTAKTQAETDNIKGDAANKPLVGANLQANTGNTQADTIMKGVQTDILRVEKEIKGRTKEDAIDTITYEASYTIAKALREGRRNGIEQGTMDTTLKTIKAEYVGLVLENILTGAKTGNVQADTKLKGAQTATEGERRFLTREQARQIGQSITLGWEGLTTEQRKIRLAEHTRMYIENEGQVLDLAEQAVDGIMRGGGGQPKGKQKWESGENPDGSRWSKESYEKYDK